MWGCATPSQHARTMHLRSPNPTSSQIAVSIAPAPPGHPRTPPLTRSPAATMITRFLTEVRVTFNPFSARSKPARLFLSLIPPNARSDGMKFSTSTRGHGGDAGIYVGVGHGLIACAEDGKEMQLDLDKMRITDVMEEVDRHSRQLARKEELTGN
jgi:large subunit ribosomal protein L53